MFEPTSRYAAIETATFVSPEGHRLPYKRRRFLPPSERMQVVTAVTVAEGDRLDQITARTLGDPEQFWRICDANNAMNPADLAVPGLQLRIPAPVSDLGAPLPGGITGI